MGGVMVTSPTGSGRSVVGCTPSSATWRCVGAVQCKELSSDRVSEPPAHWWSDCSWLSGKAQRTAIYRLASRGDVEGGRRQSYLRQRLKTMWLSVTGKGPNWHRYKLVSLLEEMRRIWSLRANQRNEQLVCSSACLS